MTRGADHYFGVEAGPLQANVRGFSTTLYGDFVDTEADNFLVLASLYYVIKTGA